MNTPLHISDDLLVKYMLDEAMPGERLQVQEWLKADEANRKYYAHFKLIWDESQTLAANITVDEDAAWQKFKNKIQSTVAENKKAKTVHFSFTKQLQVAAAVLLLCCWCMVGVQHQFNKPAVNCHDR